MRFTSLPAKTSLRAPTLVPVPFDTRFKKEDHPPVVSGRGRERRGRRAKPNADLHGHQGRPSHRAADAPRQGVVPPNNQGNATPFYNRRQRREPSQRGRRNFEELDRYTQQSIAGLDAATSPSPASGMTASTPTSNQSLTSPASPPGKDSQGGYNLHLMALDIPV